MNDAARLAEALAEIARLRAQLAALTAERAAVFGALEPPKPDDDTPNGMRIGGGAKQ